MIGNANGVSVKKMVLQKVSKQEWNSVNTADLIQRDYQVDRPDQMKLITLSKHFLYSLHPSWDVFQ